jgi:hypothetical protein
VCPFYNHHCFFLYKYTCTIIEDMKGCYENLANMLLTIFTLNLWRWSSSRRFTIRTLCTRGSSGSTESVLSTQLTTTVSHVVSSQARLWNFVISSSSVTLPRYRYILWSLHEILIRFKRWNYTFLNYFDVGVSNQGQVSISIWVFEYNI